MSLDPFNGPDVHLNLNIRGLGPSATLAVNERSRKLRSEGRRVGLLGLGQSPFPVPEPVVEALRRNAHQKDYLPVQGLPELREAVAAHHRRQFGIETSAEDVLVGPGSKELMFLLQLVYYGDVVVPTPAWVSYAPQARIIGRHVQFVSTCRRDGWRLTPEQLDSLCRLDPGRPRVLILNSPSNPTGGSYRPDELAEIAEIARRERVVVLSDEIYAKIHHRDDHHSMVPLYPEGTIFSGGLSKWCGAGGWRLGVFVVPSDMRWLLEAMAAAASETFTSTSAPIQHAAIRAFEGGPEIDDYLERSRRVLRILGGELVRRLHDAGADVPEPDGGFYLFVDLEPLRERLARRGVASSNELCERLLVEAGVAVLPGSSFGRPRHELNFRLAYVDFDGAAALHAAGDRTRADALADATRPTVEAVDRLCDWIRAA